MSSTSTQTTPVVTQAAVDAAIVRAKTERALAFQSILGGLFQSIAGLFGARADNAAPIGRVSFR